MTPSVSIVINTLNRINYLPAALEAISRLRYERFEVIVVDGPSTDGTEEYLRKHWGQRIKLRKCPVANLSISRNIGISAASGDIVAFTDDDGVPEPDWLSELVEEYSDHSVAAVGGFVRDHTGVDFQTKYIVSDRSGNSNALIDNQDSVPKSDPRAHEFPGLIGVNSSFRRSCLNAIKGFDEHYAYYLDETDVIARLVDCGYKIVINPNAQVHHKYAPSETRDHRKRIKAWDQIISSYAYFCIKNSAGHHSVPRAIANIAATVKGAQNGVFRDYCHFEIDKQEKEKLLRQIKDGAESGILNAAHPRSHAHYQPEEGCVFKQFPQVRAQSARRRIAFVTQLFHPRKCGGVAVFMSDLAKYLSKQGHEVTIITEHQDPIQHTVDWEDGLWVHRISSKFPKISKPQINDELQCLPENLANYSLAVYAEVERMNGIRRFDLVVGTIWDCDLLATALLSDIPVATYLVTNYGLAAESKPEWVANKQFYESHVMKVIDAEKRLIESSSYILTSTNAILRDIERTLKIEIPRAKTHLVPFGSQDIASPPSEYSASGELRILFVGRLEKRKGVVDLFAAIEKIAPLNNLVTFHIVGDNTIVDAVDGNYMANFIAKNAGKEWLTRVNFKGHVTDLELIEEYQNCDIFVAPSEYESFGLIFLEAMRFGKPCIGTNIGGIPEIITQGETGILVRPNASDELVDALLTLIQNPEIRSRIGLAGLRRYKDRFTTEKFADRFMSFFSAEIKSEQ